MSMSSPLFVSSSSPPWPDTSSSSDTQHLNHMQQPSSILHLSFNQDSDCFAVGTTDGFIVYNTDPFAESFRRNFSGGGIRIVQMLFRCNILALVGAVGPSRNKVMIWDDHLNRYIGELIFRSEVKAVRLRRDRIVVVLLQKIHVYDFSDLKLIHQIETQENPLGLCEISQSKESMVLVCSGLRRGYVWVEHYAMKKRKHVMAHKSSVALVALMNDGGLMATASSKGTLIRVFSTTDGLLLHEFRRGSERAAICSLCFSSNAQWLAVSSDKGTVHVFNLKAESKCSQNAETKNHAPLSVSRLSFVKGVLPKYFSSKWSVAQFHVQEGLQHIVSFGQQLNAVAIIGCDGRYYRCEFDPVLGGVMTQLECHNL